jgi:hypothetical protein
MTSFPGQRLAASAKDDAIGQNFQALARATLVPIIPSTPHIEGPEVRRLPHIAIILGGS